MHKPTGGLRKALPVPNRYSRTNLVHTGQGRQAIIAKLDTIRLDRVTFDGLSLREVVQRLSDEARKRDPEKHGVDLLVILDPTPEDIGAMPIKLSPPLINIRLQDVLDAIVKAADRPIKYSIEDYAIVFSPKEREPPALYARRYEVGTNAFLNGLRAATGLALTNRSESIVPALRAFLAEAGVDLDSRRNPEKYLFWAERQDMLLVRATMQELDIIEAAIQMLNAPPDQDSGIRQSANLVAPVVAPGSNERPRTIAQAKPITMKWFEELTRQLPPPTPVVNTVPPQINIKCKLVEVSEDDWVDDSKPLGYDWYMSSVLGSARANGRQAGSDHSSNSMSPFTQAGSLSDPQMRMVIKSLQQRIGAEFLADTKVSADSGRQVQCKATYVQNVFKGISEQALTFPGIASTNDDESSAYATKPMEFGVTLDLVPTVMEDGNTINLPVIATVLGFLGYADTRTNTMAVYINGKEKWATPPVPRVRIQLRASTVNVRDGQTVVLVAPVPERIATMTGHLPVLGNVPGFGPLFRSDSKNNEKRSLLVFLTPTIIDPAGNRVHAADETPLPRSSTAPQPGR